MTTGVSDAASAEGPASIQWGIISLSLCMLLSSLGTSIANVALPRLAEAWDASFQAVQWVVIAYLLAVTVFIVSAGRLGDLIGRRRLLLMGLSLFTLASIVCGLAPTLWILIAARMAQGLAAAVLMALTMALVGETVPKARTGRAMGLLGTMSAIGTALGPSLGGILISTFDWRAIFLVNVPLGALALFLAWRYLPADRSNANTARGSLDHRGTLLLALTLVAYGLAMTVGTGSFGWLNGVLLLIAVIGAGVFLRAETKSDTPLVRLVMLRDRVLSAGLLTSLLVSTVMMATLVVGPFYLSGALRLDAAVVGLIVSVGPIVVALTGIPAGRLVDRLGSYRMIVIGLTGIGSGSAILALLPMKFGVPGYVIPLVIVTAGYSLFQTANNTMVMQDVPKDRRGVVSGMLNLSRNLGLITGASAMAAVFAMVSETVDVASAIPAAVASGMAATFAVAAILAAIAWVVALRMFRRSSHF